MEYRIYIDNVLINDLPNGFDNVVLSIERDPELDGVFYKYGSPLTFVGDGYTALKAKFDASFCNTATIKIQQRCNVEGSYTTIFEGIIQLAKCIFNLSDCYVEVTLSDDVISAKIANNWRISGVINTNRSVGRVAITAASKVDLDLFTPQTGTYDKTGRMAFSIYEAFEWLVAYITDGTVQFASATFGGGGTYEYWYIATGLSVRTTSGSTAPNISFYDLYLNINKQIPLGFWIEDNAGTPRLRVEERSYFYSNTNVLNMRNIGGDGLIAKVAEDMLYAKVEMGSQSFTPKDSDGGPYNYVDNEFFGWKPQEYGFTINCNIDNSLDLRTEFIIDNNTIEDILVNDNDEYDTRIVLIVGEEYSLGQYRAIKYDQGSGGENYYNEPTMQFQVAQRWQSYIPGSFSKWLQLASVDDTFEANTGFDAVANATTSISGTYPYPFDNEVFDNGGNYDSATNYRYVCSNDGLYQARVELNYTMQSFSAPGVETTVFVHLYHRDSTGTVITTVTESYTAIELEFGQEINIVAEGFFPAEGGITPDYFDVEVEYETDTGTSNFTILATSNFSVVSAPGTVVQFQPSADPIIKVYEFKYPLSVSQWNTIKTVPNQSITISADKGTDDDIVCWISRIDYEPQTGLASLTLMSR